MSAQLITGLLCVTCLIIGTLFGAFLAGKSGHRRNEAPAPVDLSYDQTNPVNGAPMGRKREPVQMCGATWYRM